MYKLIIVFVFIISAQFVFSQSTESINDKTYDYLLNAQWDSLILNGNNLLANNTDYFYLRVRMGMAYYEKQNYIKAIRHFEKALEFNPGDSYTLDYLYYSYLFMGWKSDANALVKKYPDVFYLKANSGFINDLYLDGGLFINTLSNHAFPDNSDNSYKWMESNMTQNMTVASCGIGGALSKNILFTVYYTNLGIDNSKNILIAQEQLEDKYNLSQNQIYTSLNYHISSGFTVSPAFHFVNVDFTTLFSNYDTSLQKVVVERRQVLLNDYAASLSFEKKFSVFGLSLYGAYSSLNNSTQKHFGLVFTSFPFGNLSLYTISTLVLQHENAKNTFIGEEKVGYKLFIHLWTEAFYTYGRLKNYVEPNSFVINNTSDIINYRVGGSLIVPIKNLSIALKYQMLGKSADFSYFTSLTGTDKINFTNHSFILSLSWHY